MQNEIDVMLVEDNPSDAELTIRALVKNRVPKDNIVHLKDGVEALEFIFCTGRYASRDINIKPKMVLLDLKMPKVNGMEVLQKIKSSEITRSVPVVVLTSSREDPDVQRCYDLGANSYIVKPVGYDNFLKAVAELGMYWLIQNYQGN